MPFLQHLSERLRPFASSVRNAFRGIPGDIAKLLSAAQLALDGVLEKLPQGFRKPVLAVSCILIAGIVLFLAVPYIPNPAAGSAEPDTAAPPVTELAARPGIIPQEDLFLPDEPDFVPGVMLGRERSGEWTVEDADSWWQNPLSGGEEEWRDRIEKTANEVLEAAP
jgi:hypothetical protein